MMPLRRISTAGLVGAEYLRDVQSSDAAGGRPYADRRNRGNQQYRNRARVNVDRFRPGDQAFQPASAERGTRDSRSRSGGHGDQAPAQQNGAKPARRGAESHAHTQLMRPL